MAEKTKLGESIQSSWLVVELFAGMGGLAEGLRRAGLPVTITIDQAADACASYEANLGMRPVQLDVRELVRLARAGWRPDRPIDLLVADPPCTPWSVAGLGGGLSDPADMLRPTVELIRLLRPRTYLVGNVPGLERAPNLGALRETIGSLAEDGYCVRDYALLDAAAYGVPQHRRRPFWFGHLGGPCLRWPAPTHGPRHEGQASLLEPLRPYVTCGEALARLGPDELGRPVKLRQRNQHSPQHGSVLGAPARVVGTSNLSDGNVLLTRDHHHVASLDEPARTLTTRRDDARLLSVSEKRDRHPPSTYDEPAFTILCNGGRAGNGGATVVGWPCDAPATTVTTEKAIPPPGHHPESGSMLSQPGAVMLSERAAALLQGLPDGWRIEGKTKRSRWSQIGQALPPALAAAVGKAILAWLKDCR